MSERRILTTKGTEKGLDDVVIDKLAASLRGTLLRANDAGYDAARRVWNGMIDKRPALIARCAGTADVIDCVRFSREHDLLVSVRGGGHNYAGKSVCDGGLLIDLSPMKGIHVDSLRRAAQAQAGLRLGEFDRETQAWRRRQAAHQGRRQVARSADTTRIPPQHSLPRLAGDHDRLRHHRQRRCGARAQGRLAHERPCAALAVRS